jgi:cytochrome c oxidase subunit 4
MSQRTYFITAGVLLALLAVTVCIGLLPLGPIKPALTLIVAAAKATLVAAFFMHLKFARPLTRLFAGVGLLWLLILISLTLADAATRGWIGSVG